MLADAGRVVAIAALFNSAKVAAAATTQLVTSSNSAQANYLPDPNIQNQLAEAARATSDACKSYPRITSDWIILHKVFFYLYVFTIDNFFL